MPEKPPHVLITDDNRLMRLMLRQCLEEAGCLVTEAENGLVAVNLFKKIRPDLILMDLSMPEMNGLEACAALRQIPECCYVPIMMLTSRDDPTSIFKAFEVGATEFTTKPLNWDILAHRVRYLIRTGHNFIDLQNSHQALRDAKNALQEANTQLEKKVEERTVKLQKITEELQQTLETLRAAQRDLVEMGKTVMLGDLLETISRELQDPLDKSTQALAHLKTQYLKINEEFELKTLTYERFKAHLSESKDVFDTNQKCIYQMAFLIKSIKQLSLDKTTEVKSQIQMKSFLEEVILSLNPLLKKTKLHVRIACDENLKFTTYSRILFRIIMTLVTNSIIHGYNEGDEGELFLNVSPENNSVVITYSDTGKGIPQETMNQLFDPFPSKLGTNNRGLGLYLVYNQITSIFKGTITCESKEGMGATFRMTIPINSPP